MTPRVRDLMRPSLITCPPGTRLGEAAALLVRHHVHAIVVADPTGLQQGVVSDTDLLAGEWLSNDAASLEAMRNLTAQEIMSTPVMTIDADAPAAQAAARMQAERVHRLVVTEMERGIGVISVSDLVASLKPANLERRVVGDVMSRGLVVCRADTPVAAAARTMAERHSRSIIIVDVNGHPLGVVTGFDLLGFVGDGDAQQPVSRLMHPPVTITPDASLRQAADLMLRHHLHRLVVVDPAYPDGMPLGLISTSDIVVEMASPGSVWQ